MTLVSQAGIDRPVDGGRRSSTTGTVRFFTYKPKSSCIDAPFMIYGLLRDVVISRRYETLAIDRSTVNAIANVRHLY